jgi:hypothetical protein
LARGASEFAVTKTALATKTWVALDIPLTEFTGLTARAHVAQMILESAVGATVYVDNVYFHK